MSTDAVTPLRHRLIEDMNARKLCAGTQRGHIHSCKRFAVFLNRSPDTATTEDIRRFQLHLAEAGVSICNRNRIMTGVRFLFRVTLRRLDLAAEIYHIREPQKIPLVISPDETRRLLAVASNLKVRTLHQVAALTIVRTTLRWREPGSNFRSRTRTIRFECHPELIGKCETQRQTRNSSKVRNTHSVEHGLPRLVKVLPVGCAVDLLCAARSQAIVVSGRYPRAAMGSHTNATQLAAPYLACRSHRASSPQAFRRSTLCRC